MRGNDVSFSGLLSAAKKAALDGKNAACYSLQETAFAMIAEASERALAFTEKKEMLVVGGVAANSRLSAMLKGACKRHKTKLSQYRQNFLAIVDHRLQFLCHLCV